MPSEQTDQTPKSFPGTARDEVKEDQSKRVYCTVQQDPDKLTHGLWG